jgi:large subunit ribosomal protein L22
MEVRAITHNVRMAPRKIREVTRKIQGLKAVEAQAILSFVPRKSARLVAKTLKSAIANAENNHELDADDLRVRMAVADKAPVMKRFIPKARGSSGPIIKRNAHIKIVLTDE